LEADAERICITGGASQNLACVLQVFTDPVYTRVWMVAPCYFLACRIFEDAGLRTRAVGEGDEGVDLVGLERELIEEEREIVGKVSLRLLGLRLRREDCSTVLVT
jgi:DNA-binding transcriptional MocR family regulator